MSTAIYNLYEAKTSFSKLVQRAAAGEEIVIARAGKPLVKLVGLEVPPAVRKPGGWEEGVRISDDFDAPLPPDLQAAFEGPTTNAVDAD